MNPTLASSNANHLLRVGQFAWARGPFNYSLSGVRLLLWEAQTNWHGAGTICGCGCGRTLLPRKHHPKSKDRDTLDHVWPKTLEGPDRLGNLLLLTWQCNSRKAGMGPGLEQQRLLREINARLGWDNVDDPKMDIE